MSNTKKITKGKRFSGDRIEELTGTLPIMIGKGYGTRESHECCFKIPTKSGTEKAYFYLYAKDFIADQVIREAGGDPEYQPWNAPDDMGTEEKFNQCRALAAGIFDKEKGWKKLPNEDGAIIEYPFLGDVERSLDFLAGQPLLITFLLGRATNLASSAQVAEAESEGNSGNGSGTAPAPDTKQK